MAPMTRVGSPCAKPGHAASATKHWQPSDGSPNTAHHPLRLGCGRSDPTGKASHSPARSPPHRCVSEPPTRGVDRHEPVLRTYQASQHGRRRLEHLTHRLGFSHDPRHVVTVGCSLHEVRTFPRRSTRSSFLVEATVARDHVSSGDSGLVQSVYTRQGRTRILNVVNL